MPNNKTISTVNLTAEQVHAFCISPSSIIRKVFFEKERVGLALLRPFPRSYYVILHDHNAKTFRNVYNGKDASAAATKYIEYLCMFA